MKKSKSLLKKTLKNLKDKQWYHQRFDGSPYLMQAIAENELKTEARKKKVGGNHTLRFCFFENDRADWYIILDDIDMCTKAMLRVAKQDRLISKKLLKAWDADDIEFYKKCKEIKKLDLSKLTDNQLIRIHNELYAAISKRNTSSAIIDGFALGSDQVIAKMVMSLLKKRGLQDNYPELFSKLTAPTRQSFINEAEISLLKIAKKIQKNKRLSECIKKNPVTKCIQLLDRFSEIKSALEKHVNKYFWSKNNYVMAYYLDEKAFMKEIKEILSTGLDIDEEIKKISSTPKRNQLVKMELLKKLKVDKYLKTLLTISDDFTWWQDERKKASYWNAHYSTLLLTAIGKRTGFSLHELKYMSPSEIKSVFENPLPLKEIRNRMFKCVFCWKGSEFEVITGSEVEKIKHFLLGNQDQSSVTEIAGLSASVGKVVGKVKVCRSATEVDKVKPGDILVAVMTRPDYVMGMKRAGAIVTNEGGITSHAAIVSRELGIPCVIGTKIATKIFKDGDLVEVDADNGIVKKVDA